MQSGPRGITGGGGARAAECGGALAPVRGPPLRFFPLRNPRAKPTRLMSPGRYVAGFRGLSFSKLALLNLEDLWPEPPANRPGCRGLRRAWPGSRQSSRGSFPPGAHEGPRKGRLCTLVCADRPVRHSLLFLRLLGTSASTRVGDCVVLPSASPLCWSRTLTASGRSHDGCAMVRTSPQECRVAAAGCVLRAGAWGAQCSGGPVRQGARPMPVKPQSLRDVPQHAPRRPPPPL